MTARTESAAALRGRAVRRALLVRAARTGEVLLVRLNPRVGPRRYVVARVVAVEGVLVRLATAAGEIRASLLTEVRHVCVTSVPTCERALSDERSAPAEASRERGS